VFFQQKTLCIVVDECGEVECHDVGTDGEFGIVFDRSISEQDIKSCNIMIFDQTNQKFLAMCPKKEDVAGKHNFVLNNYHIKFLAHFNDHEQSSEKKVPVFSICDQPVSEHFTEEFELHCSQKHNDLLHTHVRDHGHSVVNTNVPWPCLKMVQCELDWAIQPGTDFVRVAQSDGQVCWKNFSQDTSAFHHACGGTSLPLMSSFIGSFSQTHFPLLKESKAMVLDTVENKPVNNFKRTDVHNDFDHEQWKETSELNKKLQPVVLMMPMDSELRIETHGNDLKNRSPKGKLVSTLPGQVLAMSWKTWHRTTKPIGSCHTRRNRRVIVLLGSDPKFLTNTKFTLYGTDSVNHPLTTKPPFVIPKQKSK